MCHVTAGLTLTSFSNANPPSPSVLTDGDTNGFVQKALEASSVYDNIVKYIVEANSSSVNTLNLAERAFDVSFKRC